MRYLVAFFNLFLFLNTHGQSNFQRINRDSVKLLISDSNLNTFYPKLLIRFNEFDTTLTLNEYQLLYYGFAFQQGYSAYADVKTKEFEMAMNEKDYGKASLLIDTVLKIIPISLRANYNKATALYLFDSISLNYSKYIKRYSNLLKAILSTGDGLSCETSFKVLFVADEYEIIYKYYLIQNFYGQSLIYPCDKMRIESNEFFKGEAMFFDISESFIQMKEQFKEPEKKKKKKRGD